MKKLLFIGAMAVISASCCNSDNKVKAIDTANFNDSVALNDDFYEHFTGGWQKNNPLKPEYSRYGAFDVLSENNELRIKELFNEMAAKKTQPGTVEQKIADLYNLGLDSTRLNAEGSEPVKADLAKIYSTSGRTALSRLIAELHTSVAAPFFAPYVEADLMNSSMNTAYLYQAGLGMGNKEYYLDAENAKIKDAYTQYVNRLFTLAGNDTATATTAAATVIKIEDAIAEGSYSNVELRDIYRSYNPMTIDAIKATYPNIDWDAYMAQAGVSLDTLIVGQPSEIAAVNTLLGTLTEREIQDYIAFHYLNSAAPFLSDDWYAAQFDFYGKVMSGKQEPKPRWKRALGVPNATLSEAVGEVYVAKYFPEENKAKMLTIVKNLQASLGQHISALTWMSDTTKARALEKLEAFGVKIGYPDKWKDYTSLVIDPSLSYWENVKRASIWSSADEIAKVGKPVDKQEWHMSTQTVNAYYNPTSNEICFPAAILQPPFFNPEADDAVNYGAIGVVIGHEMTHGFDDQGRQFDKVGNLTDWWTAEDAAAFDTLTKVLVEQFDKVEVLPGEYANGALTLGENIADQGGLRVAYTAYRNTLNGKEPAPIDGLTADQRFYVAYATVWAQNIRPEEVKLRTKQDVHSLGKWRVDATLRNIDTFYTAFGIKEGDAMYLAPEKRVIIW